MGYGGESGIKQRESKRQFKDLALLGIERLGVEARENSGSENFERIAVKYFVFIKKFLLKEEEVDLIVRAFNEAQIDILGLYQKHVPLENDGEDSKIDLKV